MMNSNVVSRISFSQSDKCGQFEQQGHRHTFIIKVLKCVLSVVLLSSVKTYIVPCHVEICSFSYRSAAGEVFVVI